MFSLDELTLGMVLESSIFGKVRFRFREVFRSEHCDESELDSLDRLDSGCCSIPISLANLSRSSRVFRKSLLLIRRHLALREPICSTITAILAASQIIESVPRSIRQSCRTRNHNIRNRSLIKPPHIKPQNQMKRVNLPYRFLIYERIGME